MNETNNFKNITFIDLRLQNSQVELILRSMELYGYNLKFMIAENNLSNEERSKKQAQLEYTYHQILALQAEQVNGKIALHDTTTKLAESMQNNNNIINLPSEKVI